VRANYPGFGVFTGGLYSGFEIDLSKMIAQRMQVVPDFKIVTPADRIATLVAGDVDAVIATMTDSVTRNQQIDFVRPHYFGSHTAIMGPKRLALARKEDLFGRTVCVPVGAASNVEISRQHAPVLLYDTPRQLIDALRLGTCTLAAHDNTLWAAAMADRYMSTRFEEKVGFEDAGWGIGLRKESGSAFANLLALIVLDFHRTGVIQDLAAKHHVPVDYARKMTELWSQPHCISPEGTPLAACMAPPQDDVEVPTHFAPSVRRFQTWVQTHLGIAVSFPMLVGQENFEKFKNGLVFTLVLVAGAITTTLIIALVFQFGLRRGVLPVVIVSKVLTSVFRASPAILLLLLGYYCLAYFYRYDTATAIGTAILAIGLSNGCFAGVAIADAAASLGDRSQRVPLIAALRLASTQIVAFVVNAARASPVAAFIGTPELLNTLNDVASVSSERHTTYIILLLYYVTIIVAVVGLSKLALRLMAPQETRS